MMKSTHQSAYSDHDDVLLLLPWFANGTLSDGELEKVKNHLKVCLVCRRELAALETVSATYRNAPSVDISYKPSFERLMVRIRQQEAGAARARAHSGRSGWRSRFGKWLTGISGSRFLTPALAMVILAAFVPIFLQSDLRSEGPNVYQTLALPGSMAKLSGDDIQIVFADNLSEQDVALFLKEVKGHILGGPSARGVYTVRILSEHGLEAALTRLRQDKRVIFAEPALGPDPSVEPQGG